MNLRVKGISIGDLTDKMEIKRESLSRTINGNPTLDPLTKIAYALDISVSELFKNRDNNTIHRPKCGIKLEIKEKIE